jgi:acyl-CoA thioester hydrolase
MTGKNIIYFEQRFRVGWSDLDANAHMANSSYLDHASNARMHFFNQNGFTVSRFASERFGPVVVRDELVYRKELKLMDEFRVDLEVAGLSQDGVRFRVRNTFRNTTNEVSALVTSDGVWFDLQNRKPFPPPKDLDDLMRALPHTQDYVEIPQRASATEVRAWL